MNEEIPVNESKSQPNQSKLIPTAIPEGNAAKVIEPEKEGKKEKTLNINAKSFVPKNLNANKKEQNNQTYNYNDQYYKNNNNNYYDQMNYYPNFKIINNNAINYQGRPFNYNAYYNNIHNIPMATNQISFQQQPQPFNNSMYIEQSNYLNQTKTYRKSYNPSNNFVPNKPYKNYQNNNTTTSATKSLPAPSPTIGSGTKSSLNEKATPYIPIARRNNNKNNEDKLQLNLNAEVYAPQNEQLKKLEESIRKQNEINDYDTPKKEDKNAKNEKQNKPKNEETPNNPKEKKNAEEKNNEQKKSYSGLKALLLNDKPKTEPKKPTKNKGKKTENNEIFEELNRGQRETEEKIKEKKIKEQEERKKKEDQERKRKEEEMQKELEEKRKREEEERKKKEEEEKRKEEELKKEEERKRKEEEERKRKEEEENKRKEEEEKNKIIEKKYFIVFKNKDYDNREYEYTFEYIMQFKKWKISNEEELLNDKAKQHLEKFKEVEKDEGKPKKRDYAKSSYYKPKSSAPQYVKSQTIKEKDDLSLEAPALSAGFDNSMGQWARKDMTKEIKAAEEFKQKLEETIKDDPIKRNLRNFLNMLTKDNYEETKEKILEVIRDNIDYQYKFLDVLLQKAVSERAYVEIYAKLCKELDKYLPQKSQPKEQKEGEKKQKPKSEMRKKLIEKCREIFQIKHNEKFDDYIKVKDPYERETKLKNFILGNVYFINELIKIKILSKKIAPDCIKDLFKRYEKEKGDEMLRLINIEAIVIFTDEFGTLVHSQEKKKEKEENKKFKENIDEIFQKLDKLKDEKGIPQYIYYKIINLIEKRKNNYKKSKIEEYRIAKSRKELEEANEKVGQLTKDDINEKIQKGLIKYRDFVEEEGSSEKYPWKETTYIYDKKGKTLDDILEGFIIACLDFLDRGNDIKYAKDYIKELIEYYENKIHKQEKEDLKNTLLKLFELVRDNAMDIPKMYDIYAYIIYIFLDNNIMKISDLESIIDEKDAIDDDYANISNVFKMVYDYYKKENFKKEIANFNFVINNSKLFEWLYAKEEKELEKNE